MNGFNLTQDIQQPQQNTQTDMTIFLTLAILLVLSAFPFTATPAMYVGLFLLLLAWMAAWQTGNLESFGTEMFSKGS